ncbi:MAG TPA: rhodanese-like domain-containing protein [Gammaproteobacteria bacterium]
MIESISPAELIQKLQTAPTSRPLLLDVREPAEFTFCRIRDSLNIPLSEIPRRIDELDQDRFTVVVCHHGRRSLQAAVFLEQNGFSNVFNLTGGIEAWANDIEPDMPRY